jgi:hypothetical protein
MTPALEKVASLLCKGEPAPDWVVPRLERARTAVGDPRPLKDTDDGSIDRLLLESAMHLKRLLVDVHSRAADLLDDEYPPGLDQTWDGLEELIPFLTEQVVLHKKRKGGPNPDTRHHLCASVCARIWEELYGDHQPRSEWLWKACEAYWVACGQPETSAPSKQRLRNWERYLLELSP